MSAPVLLFGAGGQLGRTIAAAAAAEGTALVGLDRRAADIADRTAVAAALAAHRPAFAINAAALADVDRAEGDPDAAFAANALGPGILAEETARRDVPLVHVSTDYVFDGALGRPYREEDATAPVNVYGRSKLEGETRLRAANPRHLIVRTAWLHGPEGAGFVGTVLDRAAAGLPVRAAADQCGTPTAAADLAAALLAAGAASAAGRAAWGTYHFAGPDAVSRFAWAEAVLAARAALTGEERRAVAARAADFPSPARRPPMSALDSGRFAAAFGITARPLAATLGETVAAFLQRRRETA